MSSNPDPARASAARSAELRRRRVARITAVVAVVAVSLVGAELINRSASQPVRSHHRNHVTPTAAAACGAQPPSPHTAPQWHQPPPLQLPPGKDFAAVIHTSCGDIKMDLLEASAPQTVANFIFLVRHGFYTGRQFFRVENNSVIQTGDPNDRNGDPPDGPGYTIPDELPTRARQYVFGVVGMANAGLPDSGGSQFFIVIHHPGPAGYDPRYSIFGQVDPSSRAVLNRIGARQTFGGTDPIKSVTPITPIYINSIDILTTAASAGGA